MINETIKCLDHGFVELVDVMGDDSAIVQAARCSYGKDKEVRLPKDDEALIRYLMRHRHTTPFEMVEFKFHCSMPIVSARQWIRHRTASVNEFSGRYGEMPEVFYVPEADRVREQSTSNKQGSSEFVLDYAAAHVVGFENEAKESFKLYQERLAHGMAKELARNNLPLSTYTRWYWKIDLHNLFHFLSLRLDSHAQYEIRVFAEAMATVVKWRCPVAWRAFEDYRLDAITFSKQELLVMARALLSTTISASFGSKREMEEWNAKMQKMGKLLVERDAALDE